MTYEEFKNMDIRALHCSITEDEKYIYVNHSSSNRPIIEISKTKMNAYSFDVAIESEYGDKLIRAVLELTGTPLEKREPEKKYYLKHKFMVSSFDMESKFLNYKDGYYFLATRNSYSDYKTQFTEREIKNLRKEFGTDLQTFEIVEIKPWEY